MLLELARRILREFEDIVSDGEVNCQCNRLFGDCFPSIDFAHADLTGGEQSPEQHRSSVGGRQHGLGLDPPLELFV
jgi:hypothetical protein